MRLNATLIIGIQTITSFFVGVILASSIVFADDSVVDEINITVPVSCTMSGVGMNTHNANITNGTYQADIGTTTLHAFCNDSEGFAIYAIGYTDNEEGNNALTNSTLGFNYNIATGTQTSGDNSAWAMKLSTVTNPTPTYPITIQNSFDFFQEVPDDYTLVAKRASATDISTSAEGSAFETTYQAYISKIQPAGTYTGQVKYTLVHPNYVDKDAMIDAITVVFDGNGLTFPDGSTTNTIKYANVCKPGDTVYVANNPYTTIGTSNLNSDGIQDENSPSYTNSENILQTITVPNADKVKIVVDYATTGNSAEAIIINDVWDGDWDNWNNDWDGWYDEENEWHDNWIYSDNDISGSRVYLFDGDTITIFADSWENPGSSYDYGFYFKIYPVYDTEQPNTTPETSQSNDCSITLISGVYQETSTWNGVWKMTVSDETKYFHDEKDVYNFISTEFINNNVGATIRLYSFNPVTFEQAFAANNKTTVTYNNNQYYKMQDMTSSICDDVSATEAMNGDDTVTTRLIDVRDNKLYQVAKLKDGNCWMTQNLDFDLDSDTTYSNLNTDIGWDSSTQSYRTAAWKPIRSTYNATPTHTHEWCIGGTLNQEYGYCEKNYTPESYDPGNLYWDGILYEDITDWLDYEQSCGSPFSTISCNQTINPIASHTDAVGIPQYHLGNYYNIAAAVSMNDVSSLMDNQYHTVTQSICPTGWTLPTGNLVESLWNQYDFGYMKVKSEDGRDMVDAPLFFVVGGLFKDFGYLELIGYMNDYRTPDITRNKASYSVHRQSKEINGYSDSFYETNISAGQSIRCIAR